MIYVHINFITKTLIRDTFFNIYTIYNTINSIFTIYSNYNTI